MGSKHLTSLSGMLYLSVATTSAVLQMYLKTYRLVADDCFNASDHKYPMTRITPVTFI